MRQRMSHFTCFSAGGTETCGHQHRSASGALDCLAGHGDRHTRLTCSLGDVFLVFVRSNGRLVGVRKDGEEVRYSRAFTAAQIIAIEIAHQKALGQQAREAT